MAEGRVIALALVVSQLWQDALRYHGAYVPLNDEYTICDRLEMLDDVTWTKCMIINDW